MLKRYIFLFLTFFCFETSSCQTYSSFDYDNSGTTEYMNLELDYETGMGKITYWTANAASNIITLDEFSFDYMDQNDIYSVSFPGSTTVYNLVFESKICVCVHPGGKVQKFLVDK